MAGNRAGKGNPATHRMGNHKRKARREASWRRGQERNATNRKRNEAQHAENVLLFGSGTAIRRHGGNRGNGSPGRPSVLRRKALRNARRQQEAS